MFGMLAKMVALAFSNLLKQSLMTISTVPTSVALAASIIPVSRSSYANTVSCQCRASSDERTCIPEETFQL